MPAGGGAWELSLRAGVLSDFDLNATSHDPVNADYLGGLYSSFPATGEPLGKQSRDYNSRTNLQAPRSCLIILTFSKR